MKKILNGNTDLCVDVKTLLRSDRRTRLGKNYTGVLTRDAEEHYTFVERQPSTDGKSNPLREVLMPCRRSEESESSNSSSSNSKKRGVTSFIMLYNLLIYK